MLPKLILLDADGVLWRGGEALPGAVQFVRHARTVGIRCVLITNNAGLSRAAYEAKCRRLGLDFGEADIYSSGYLAGPYLAQNFPAASVLIIGSSQLVEGVAAHAAAARANLEVADAHRWLAERELDGRLNTPEQLAVLDGVHFDAVLMGIDINVDYATLALAGVVCARGAALIAANDDATFPFEGGMTLPGNGSFVNLVAAVAGVTPTLLGKPELHLLELIERETGIFRGEMLMVGDRIETDIEFARRGGLPAFLVLTGVTPPDSAPPPGNDLRIAADLEEVAAAMGL